MRLRIALTGLLVLRLLFASSAAAAEETGFEFFEQKVRPVLVAHCYQCRHHDDDKPGDDHDEYGEYDRNGEGARNSPLLQTLGDRMNRRREKQRDESRREQSGGLNHGHR